MGLADRSYMRHGSGGMHWSATTTLIVALIVAFVLQKLVLPASFTYRYLALSIDGIRHGFVWELLSFQFLHADLLHLLFNGLMLFFLGRELEWILGKTRFLTLYFMSGVFGGVLQMVCAWVWPNYFGASAVGASAGVCGLLSVFALRDPHRQLTLLLFFVIPLRMRARTLLIIGVVLAALGIAYPQSAFGGNVAHAAHMGGFLVGMAWIRFGWHVDYVRLPWEKWAEQWSNWQPGRARRRKRELMKAASATVQRRSTPDDSDVPSEEFISSQVDPILDKISEHGIQSLTERERRILESARNRMAKR